MKLLLAVYYLALIFLEIVNSQEEPIQGMNYSLHSLLTQNTFHYKGACDNVGDIRLVHKRGDNFGAVQVCIRFDGWRYLSRGGAWTEGAARLACRELNLGYLSKRL